MLTVMQWRSRGGGWVDFQPHFENSWTKQKNYLPTIPPSPPWLAFPNYQNSGYATAVMGIFHFIIQ